MMRLVTIGITAMVAVLIGDLVFRTSLLRLVRPVIVEPADSASVAPPVRLRWEGPQHMRVTLRYAGREDWDLGVREAPVEIPNDYLSERGLYSVEVRSPSFGAWIAASRTFFVTPSRETAAPARDSGVGAQLEALQKSVEDLKGTQDEMRDENSDLYEENASTREENAILTEELNRVAEAEQRANGQLAAMERQYNRLVDEHRALLDEASQLRQRLTAVNPCTVWGYFSYPRPQTIPVTRRIVTVSNGQAEIFRTQDQCEDSRRRDPTNASPCFCVGSTWGQ